MLNKYEIVKSWGFTESTVGGEFALIRKASKDFIEVWDPENDQFIEIINSDGVFSHSYEIDWSVFLNSEG